MPVRQSRYSKEEFTRRGAEIYERDIRPQVEADSAGKFVAIDIETGAWEMDADDYTATERLFHQVPDAQIWLVRVGHIATYRTRTINLISQMRLDKTAFSVSTLDVNEDEDTTFWHSRTVEERLTAMEWMRQVNYGYDATTQRLQRVLTVIPQIRLGKLED